MTSIKAFILLNSKEISALKIIEHYRKLLLAENLSVSMPQKHNFNYRIEIINQNNKVSLLVYFGKKGNKTLLQGNNETPLYKNVSKIIFGEKLFSEQKKDIDLDTYIGTDESGKGDFFGPLVIAGVFVDPFINKELMNLGVKDSKVISDLQIKTLASKIKKVINKKFDAIVISPEKYNELHNKMGNVNKILGWAHARVLENILNKCKAENAISDKFGNERLILDSLQEKGKDLTLYQTSKAERYTAVAAASIIARDIVIKWFESNSQRIGFKIPKGASNAVEVSAKKIINNFGEEKLKLLVKIHFKTSQKVFKSI